MYVQTGAFRLRNVAKRILPLFLIILLSCSDNVDRFQGVCLLKKSTFISGFDSFVRQWEYSSNTRLAKLTAGFEGATPVVSTYSYDGNAATITDTQGNTWVYNYDNNFQLISILYDPAGENSIRTFEYLERQINMVYQNNSPGLEYTVTSEYNLDFPGGNIVNEYTVVEQDGVVMQEYEKEFQYSTGINPYSMLMFPGMGDVPLLMSANTVTKVVTTDIKNNSSQTVNYSYTYDTNQLPLTVGGGETTLEYDCR